MVCKGSLTLFVFGVLSLSVFLVCDCLGGRYIGPAVHIWHFSQSEKVWPVKAAPPHNRTRVHFSQSEKVWPVKAAPPHNRTRVPPIPAASQRARIVG